jgi:hypothetical protein
MSDDKSIDVPSALMSKISFLVCRSKAKVKPSQLTVGREHILRMCLVSLIPCLICLIVNQPGAMISLIKRDCEQTPLTRVRGCTVMALLIPGLYQRRSEWLHIFLRLKPAMQQPYARALPCPEVEFFVAIHRGKKASNHERPFRDPCNGVARCILHMQRLLGDFFQVVLETRRVPADTHAGR